MENNFTITKNILPEYGNVAFYLRLSMADGDLSGDKSESNSIENQRILLQEYIKRVVKSFMNDEYDKNTIEFLSKAYLDTVVEYIDDGYTGTNFDRPAFKRMIESAKRNEINTIIVKDTSRLGRDYIEVGDYMEQIFPLLGIRFIAINNYYDSNDYKGTTIGLETSITNLINSEYSKDLSRKIKSSRKAMWSKGVPTCSKAPFGYITQNKRYVLDLETAPYVRLIYDKALEGLGTRAIVEHLNTQGVPPPGIFYKKRTGKSSSVKVVSDDEYMWDTWMVHRVLTNYSYTGSMVQGKYKRISVGKTQKRINDQKDWIILENTHPPIVSVDEWNAAQLVIKSRPQHYIKISTNFVLKGKLRCGTCGLMLEHKCSYVYCTHAQAAGNKSKCCKEKYDAQKLIFIATCELKRQMELLELLELKIQEHHKKENSHIDLETLRKQTKSTIEILNAEKIRLYESYAEGIVSKDIYIKKKAEIAEKIKTTEEKLQNAEQTVGMRCEILSEMKQITENYSRQISKNTPSKPITRETVVAMIDCITIFDENTIEIKFKFDDIGRRAVEYLEEHGIKIEG